MKKFSSLLLLVGLLLSCSAPKEKPFVVVQITDPQLGFNNGEMTAEIDLFERAAAKINALQPDEVVITGDFFHSVENEAQLAEYRRLCALIDTAIPLRMIPGNHDMGDDYPSNIARYKQRFGEDRFADYTDHAALIGINTCYMKDSAEVYEKAQYEWLEAALQRAKELKEAHIIVFGHHPIAIKAVDEAENYSNLSPEMRKRYLDLFERYGVDYYVSGHLHDNALVNYHNIKLHTTTALGQQLGSGVSGVEIFTITKDSIIPTFYAVDEIPSAKK